MKTIIIIISFWYLSAQDGSPYLDTANELLVRKKLANRLPDVFDNSKFESMVEKLDNIAQIGSKTHSNRLKSNNPEFHWCYAQTYLLAGKANESLDHYRQYKILLLESTAPIHNLFEKPINELEIVIANQQSNLAGNIYDIINDFKNTKENLDKIQIQELQNKLNIYNELNRNTQVLNPDGIMGSLTKTAIYDFEENNPYFISKREIESSQTAIEISSLNTIKTVSVLPQKKGEATNFNETGAFDKKSIQLMTTIIINSDKINSMPVSSIAEVLEYTVGLDINRRGASDVLASVSTFGGTGEQTLILIDGLKISNQSSLHHDFDLPINLHDIDRIEVMRNPAARHFGTGAVSGIINIITKNGSEKQSHIAGEYGDYSLLNGNIGLNIPIGKSFHSLSLSNISSSGYLLRTDFNKRTFFYKYSLEDGKTSTNFSFGYLNRDNSFFNKASSIYKRQFEKNTTKFFNSNVKWNFGKVKLSSNTHWYNYTDEMAPDKDIDSWHLYSNSEIGYNVKTDFTHRFGNSNSGFTFSRETNSNTTLKENHRNHYSFNLQHGFTLGSTDMNIGSSISNHTDYGWYFAPGYQLVYHMNENASIYHLYDHGYRIPSFYELYANDYIFVGDNELNSEIINSWEYGIEIYGSAANITLNIFYKNSDNVIDWLEKNSGSIKWEASNVSSVLTSGHNIRFKLFPELMKRFKYFQLFELGYVYLDITAPSSKKSYRYLSNYLKHQLTLHTQYKLPLKMNQTWIVRFEQPMAFSNRVLIDTQLSFPIWRIVSNLNINNVFNVEYEDVEDITLPGRWIRFSLRYNL